MRRLFPIPAAGALGAGISGCADPIVGDWLCTDLNGREMPYVSEFGSGSDIYTYRYSVSLKVWPDLGAQIRFQYQYTADYGDVQGRRSYGYVLRADIVVGGERSYLIDFEYDELDCAMTEDKSALDCEAVEGDTLTFEAQEDED